jgi:hypothetical protein
MLTLSMAADSNGKLAGDWMVGCELGGHVHVEDDETNPMVLTEVPNDDRRRPATRGAAAAARTTAAAVFRWPAAKKDGWPGFLTFLRT